jgi:hypothetical protein
MFGKIFRGIGKGVKAVTKTAVPLVLTAVEPAALINLAAGAALKHTPYLKDNNKIPYINMALSTGFSYNRLVIGRLPSVRLYKKAAH